MFDPHDARVARVANEVSDIADEIAELLARIATLKGKEQQAAYRKLNALLTQLQEYFDGWLDDEFDEQGSKNAYIRLLKLAARNSMLAALATVRSQATSLLYGRRSKAVTAKPQLDLLNLRKEFRNSVVRIINSKGGFQQYSIDYYLSLVAFMAVRAADTAAVIADTHRRGWDAVRVSKHASKFGDYCDAYAGKVFSITGADRRLPPLDRLPNGGPPFHPWCTHTIEPFDTDAVDSETLEAMAELDPRMLLRPGEVGISRIYAVWRKAYAV